MTTEAWSASTHYHVNDEVTSDGKTWRAEHANVGDEPPGRSWEEVVASGGGGGGAAAGAVRKLSVKMNGEIGPGGTVAWDNGTRKFSDGSGDVVLSGPPYQHLIFHAPGVYLAQIVGVLDVSADAAGKAMIAMGWTDIPDELLDTQQSGGILVPVDGTVFAGPGDPFVLTVGPFTVAVADSWANLNNNGSRITAGVAMLIDARATIWRLA